MSARQEKIDRRDQSPSIGYAEPAEPRLAEGTRRDIDVQRTKGICVATRCHHVDQFVSTFHRYCEDSAIFIFNARRPVGTILPFSFELVNEESVLVGLGRVVEEFTTAQNRFARAGIVIAVQKLKRESIAVFQRLLAARNAAEVDRHTPPPVFARAMTAPIPLEELLRARRPTKPIEVKIPSPLERPTAKPRANTVLGVPVIAKLPAKQAVMQIPAISPRSRTGSIPEPPPVVQAPGTDAVPEALAGEDHDTVRDEIPFALRNELRLLESASLARLVAVDAAVDVGWDDEPVPQPVPEAIAVDDAVPAIVAHEAVSAHEAVALTPAVSAHETVALTPAVSAHETVALTPAVAAEAPVPSREDDAVPVMTEALALDAETTRNEAPDLLIASSSAWRRSLRWAARIALASTLFVTSAAVTASIPGPSLPVATEPAAAFATQTASVESADEHVTATVPEAQPPPHVAPNTKPAPAAVAAKRARRVVSKAHCKSLECL